MELLILAILAALIFVFTAPRPDPVDDRQEDESDDDQER